MHLCRGNDPSSEYYVDVSPPPSQVTSSSTITITCYEDSSLRVAIPSDVVWTRVHHGWSKVLPNQGHAFTCTPSDIGSSIQIQVTAKNPSFRQTNSIHIVFGPINLDPLLRPNLENILKNSVASFAVLIHCCNKSKQYVLHISDTDLEIKDPRTGSNIKSTYSAIEPEFIENTHDSTANLIVPKQNEEDYVKFFNGIVPPSNKSLSLQIRFNDRNLRDTFILAKKAFVVKRELRFLSILQNSLDSTMTNNSVDLLIEMSSIKSFNEFLIKKKQVYRNEVELLQQQIIDLRDTYQNILKEKVDKPDKPKFQQVLSLLDSSDHSKRLGFGHSQFFLNLSHYQKFKLAVIGQQNLLESEVKVNSSQNVIYSQVYPFNQSKLSKKFSLEERHINSIQQHNSNSEKSQSILDSSNQISSHFNRSIKQIQRSSKVQLYNAWQEEAHKNFVLQSKIQQLQLANNKSTVQNQNQIELQNNKLKSNIHQKQQLIELLNAQNTNLKMQIDNEKHMKEAYKSRCDDMKKSLPLENSLHSEFESQLLPQVKEGEKLMKESQHLNELLRQVISHQIDKSHIK